MKRIVVILILLIFSLMGCNGKLSSSNPIEPNGFSIQGEPSSSATGETEPVEDLKVKDTAPKKEAVKLLNYVNTALDDVNLENMPTAVSVTDTNGDHLPEIILEQGDGWNYHVYYYADGSVQEVGDLTAWAWSSDLLKSPTGDLVLRTHAHTTGTAGLLQYRLFHWDGTRYKLAADLCRTVAHWDYSDIYNPVPSSFSYFLSDTCIDFNKTDEEGLASLCEQITQEEFDMTIASLGELTSLREQARETKRLETREFEPEDAPKQISEFLRSELNSWQ